LTWRPGAASALVRAPDRAPAHAPPWLPRGRVWRCRSATRLAAGCAALHAETVTARVRGRGGHLGRGRAQVHVLLRVREGPRGAVGAAGLGQPECEVRGAPAESIDGLARAEAAGAVEGLARRGQAPAPARGPQLPHSSAAGRTALRLGRRACLTLKLRSGFFASAANGDGYSGTVIARAAQACCHAPSQQARLIAPAKALRGAQRAGGRPDASS